MNRHCIPGLTMSTALTGNFSAECRNNKTMHTGFKRVHVLHYANAHSADTEEMDVMILAWKDLCVF